MSEADTRIDSPKEVREEERLDEETLAGFLEAEIEGFEAPIDVQQFRSGYSNLTYFIASNDGREFVLRRPPFGANVETGHDMKREYTILSHLAPVFDKVPATFLYTDDDDIIGAPFYVMERMRGVILRGPDPRGVDLDRDTMRGVCRSLVETLVQIHDVDWRAAGLDDLGKPEGYVERQISGWTRRWEKAKTEDVPDIDDAARWLADHLPDEGDASLIHNDFKYDNLVLDPDDLARVLAVLDWEMATIGDPLMDLGTSLGYWVEPDDPPILQAVVGPTALPGNMSRRQIVDYYTELSGRNTDDVLFYYVYGLFKIAVIGQQIYYRYDKGYTTDERFAMLIHAVKLIGERAKEAITTGEI